MDASDICTLDSSHRREQLFDIIDSLRDYDVDKYVGLPQIIVVGDQSSGKSSVLEAISRVRFPSKSELCTRFTTELSLRRNGQHDSIKVTIKPASDDDSKETQERIDEFHRLNFNGKDLPEIIQTARKYMGITDCQDSFSKATLKVAISGPKIQPLTLIDLPGFYHAEDDQQSEIGKKIVTDLAVGYMKQPNSVILAVVTAKSKPIMQQVLAELKKCDPEGKRTMGIITKPDKLDLGSSDEDEFLELLGNAHGSPHRLKKHGWHVLRNRGEKESDSFDDRDKAESALFRQRPWSKIPQAQKGIVSLRDKLGRVLEMHILQGMPALVAHMVERISKCKKDLEKLGEARETYADRLRYLEKIARGYTCLADDAVTGRYDDTEFFVKRLPTDNCVVELNLRSSIRFWNRVFTAVMYRNGAFRTQASKDKGDTHRESWRDAVFSETILRCVPQYDTPEPEPWREEELRKHIESKERTMKGMELPVMTNAKVVLHLFKDQVQKWRHVGTRHIDMVMMKASLFVELAFRHILQDDEEAWFRVLNFVVRPKFERLRTTLEKKLDELLPQLDKKSFLVADEDFFGQSIELERDERARRFASSRQDDDDDDDDKNEHHGYNSDTLEDTMTYVTELYKTHLNLFTQNLILLGVENVLMRAIPTIFTTEEVVSLDDSLATALCEESEDLRDSRDEKNMELEILTKGLQLCQEWGDTCRTALQTPPRAKVSGRLHNQSVPRPEFSGLANSKDTNGLEKKTTTPRVNGLDSSAGPALTLVTIAA